MLRKTKRRKKMVPDLWWIRENRERSEGTENEISGKMERIWIGEEKLIH